MVKLRERLRTLFRSRHVQATGYAAVVASAGAAGSSAIQTAGVLAILTAFFLWIAELAMSIVMPLLASFLGAIPGMTAETSETVMTWFAFANKALPIAECFLFMAAGWSFTVAFAGVKLFVKIFLPTLG